MHARPHHLLAPLSALILCCLSPLTVSATEEPDLTDLPLESLMNMTVTSVSKKAQTIMDAPAAIFVITAEDIRRAGVRSLPEALRMAPGIQVARIDGNNWAISARGFNGRFSNKLLVLLDGRTIYSNLYSGVFWDLQDTLLEDIERIEVIRGPGAALWGANAVNGVINIITRNSHETSGTVLRGGIGSEERGFVSGRQGFRLGESTTGRVYAKYFKRHGLIDQVPYDNADRWEQARGGFRIDTTPGLDDTATVQGDAMYGEDGVVSTATLPAPDVTDPLNPQYYKTSKGTSRFTSINLLGRWDHRFANASHLTSQLYYDYLRSSSGNAYVSGEQHTVDLDLQHRFTLLQNHDVIWGGSYRLVSDSYQNKYTVSLSPDHKTSDLISMFVQDDITLVPQQVRLILGSKLEHNDYTGWEVQPSARLLYTPTERHSAWASVSRAVRTPSRIEHGVTLNTWQEVQAPNPYYPDYDPRPTVPVTIPAAVVADGTFKSEILVAYEAGYRWQTNDRLFLDLAVFYNHYNRLRTLEPSFNGTSIHIDGRNNMKGESFGVEVSGEWHPTDWLRLQPAYSALWLNLHTTGGSTDTTSVLAERAEPRHQVSLRTSLNLGHNVDFDTWVRYVDTLRLPVGTTTQTIDRYVTVDVRLAWRPLENLELSVVGQNLVEPRHYEYITEIINSTQSQVGRSIYGMITWRH